MMKINLMMVSLLAAIATLGMSGCNNTTGGGDGQTTAAVDNHAEHGDESHADHDHSGWWCGEHGVPEEECALCDTSLVAAFKAKGDWCEEHNRPDSQCFICDASRVEPFAARYEAKYGDAPPKPTE